jgi:hypothetical protein
MAVSELAARIAARIDASTSVSAQEVKKVALREIATGKVSLHHWIDALEILVNAGNEGRYEIDLDQRHKTADGQQSEDSLQAATSLCVALGDYPRAQALQDAAADAELTEDLKQLIERRRLRLSPGQQAEADLADLKRALLGQKPEAENITPVINAANGPESENNPAWINPENTADSANRTTVLNAAEPSAADATSVKITEVDAAKSADEWPGPSEAST